MASKVRWITFLMWDGTKVVLSAMKNLLFNREYHGILLVSLLYYAVLMVVALPLLVNELQRIEAILGWTVLLGVPIYGLGIEIAQRQLSQDVQSIRFWGWKHRTRVGLEVVVITLVFIALPEVIVGAVTGSLATLFPDLLATFIGYDISGSGWYQFILYVGGLFVLPAVLLNYSRREQLSDLFPISHYISILRDRDYIVLTIGFIFAQHIPILILYFIGVFYSVQVGYGGVLDPTNVYYMMIHIGYLILHEIATGRIPMAELILSIFPLLTVGMSITLGIFLSFHILGANAQSIRPLRQTWKVFCDTTVQTKLSHFKDSNSGARLNE